MKLSKRDIRQGYKGVKKLAQQAFDSGNCRLAMKYLDVCSDIGGQFNLLYQDNDVDYLLEKIAHRTIKELVENFIPDNNRWILYDDFCTTYVLALQWLEAMAKSGKEILYITTRDINVKNVNRSIIPDAEQFGNVHVFVVPQGDIFERAKTLYNTIFEFQACKLVMHKHASISPIQLVLPVLPKGIERYVINLSDQTYWNGARHIDYCLEFRQFGANVSIQRRGLKKEQLLLVPFYPADDKNSFSGYPSECTDDKIIIFSGGDYYKTLDDKRTYWNLVKSILDKYHQVVFLFATKNIPEGDGEIHQFIRDNQFEHRFIYINFRPDIYQVFAHCDIYMGTCPTSGSLMSGLAAVNAKPILQFYKDGTPDDETEQAICYNDNFNISYHNEVDFMAEADKLIKDAEYRKSQGERLQKSIISKEQFNKLVVDTLESNKTQREIREFSINYDGLDDRWFYLEKNGYINSIPYIYGILGASECVKYAPSIFIKKNFNRLLKHFTK